MACSSMALNSDIAMSSFSSPGAGTAGQSTAPAATSTFATFNSPTVGLAEMGAMSGASMGLIG